MPCGFFGLAKDNVFSGQLNATTCKWHDLGYVEVMTKFRENHPMQDSVSWEQACSTVKL